MITQMRVSKREFLKIKKKNNKNKQQKLTYHVFKLTFMSPLRLSPKVWVRCQEKKKGFISTPDTNKSFIAFLYKGEVAF